MSEYKIKQKYKQRIIAAALVVAASILGGALLNSLNSESAAVIWLTTAVYMAGPILAALIVWPLTAYDGWLFLTAVLLSCAVVIPWAFINPAVWAANILSQLGQWANVLFIILLIIGVSAERPSRRLSWALTGFYCLIMLVLPVLL